MKHQWKRIEVCVSQEFQAHLFWHSLPPPPPEALCQTPPRPCANPPPSPRCFVASFCQKPLTIIHQSQLLGALPQKPTWHAPFASLHRLKEYARWYFQVFAHVRLLRREPSTCGQVGWVPTLWVGVEEGGFKKIARGGQPVGLPKNCKNCVIEGELLPQS